MVIFGELKFRGLPHSFQNAVLPRMCPLCFLRFAGVSGVLHGCSCASDECVAFTVNFAKCCTAVHLYIVFRWSVFGMISLQLAALLRLPGRMRHCCVWLESVIRLGMNGVVLLSVLSWSFLNVLNPQCFYSSEIQRVTSANSGPVKVRLKDVFLLET